MKYLLLTLALFAVGTNAMYAVEDESVLKTMWDDYKNEYDRAYETEAEESKRYAIFVSNLAVIDHHNALEEPLDGAIHGITKFMDLTAAEFKARFLTYVASGAGETAPIGNLLGATKGDYNKDWTGKLTTSVKDQAQCGSCWAFSATEQIESDTMRQLNETYVLSPQQIVSCDKVDVGCDGGDTYSAYKYVEKAGGIVLNKDYKYTSGTGNTGTCKKAKLSDKKVTVKAYKKITGETNMAKYVASTGPLSICVAASSWQTYTSGIKKSCDKEVDHCVQAVGINTPKGYWKVRNSWGTSWGESGMIRLKYGKNMCAITNEPTWVTVAKV